MPDGPDSLVIAVAPSDIPADLPACYDDLAALGLEVRSAHKGFELLRLAGLAGKVHNAAWLVAVDGIATHKALAEAQHRIAELETRLAEALETMALEVAKNA